MIEMIFLVFRVMNILLSIQYGHGYNRRSSASAAGINLRFGRLSRVVDRMIASVDVLLFGTLAKVVIPSFSELTAIKLVVSILIASLLLYKCSCSRNLNF